VAYVAATSPVPTYRFLSHQFLARLIELCTDEASVYLLIEILKNCPFEGLRACAIGLTKQQIDIGLRRKQQDQTVNIYTSPLVVKEFFPVIFNYDGMKMITSESQFWDTYSTVMQAINFYYYLLISDEKNKSVSLICSIGALPD
ncbi:YAP-binding/ALF4/Glomulin, partial [Umbelopsis sp. PMI_123]